MELTIQIPDDTNINMKKYGDIDIEQEEEFTVNDNPWTELTIKDGTKLFIKPTVTRVLKTTQIDNLTHEPIYIILSTNVTKVQTKNETI